VVLFFPLSCPPAAPTSVFPFRATALSTASFSSIRDLASGEVFSLTLRPFKLAYDGRCTCRTAFSSKSFPFPLSRIAK